MPKLGDVLIVKSVEEPVTFITERKMTDEDRKRIPVGTQCEGTIYVVRRAVFSPTQGIALGYKYFDFLKEELETSSDNAKRQLARLKERSELAMGDFDMGGSNLDKLVKN